MNSEKERISSSTNITAFRRHTNTSESLPTQNLHRSNICIHYNNTLLFFLTHSKWMIHFTYASNAFFKLACFALSISHCTISFSASFKILICSSVIFIKLSGFSHVNPSFKDNELLSLVCVSG